MIFLQIIDNINLNKAEIKNSFNKIIREVSFDFFILITLKILINYNLMFYAIILIIRDSYNNLRT